VIRAGPTRWGRPAVIAGLVVLAGCGGPAPAPRVAVVGDSTTALAQPAIASALAPRYDPGYVFRISIRTDQILGLVAIAVHDSGPPWGAVVNLGTNDAVQGRSVAQATGAYGQLLALLEPAHCVVLTTVGSNADLRGHSTVAAALNRQIAAEAAADPARFRVVDWNAFLAGLDPATRRTYLRPDGIHETDLGATWLASADRAALDDCRHSGKVPLIGPAA
jgi:hypothetical protein